VRVARPALDAEALRQGVALIALYTFVGLALGLVLVVASRSTQLSPILEKGGSPRWLAWPFHEIAPETRRRRAHTRDAAFALAVMLAATIVAIVMLRAMFTAA